MQFVSRGLDGSVFRNRTPVLIQTEAAECGLACLTMIAGRYGRQMDIQVLRQQYSLSLKGMTLREITRLAGSLNLATRALRAEVPHLQRLRLPAILHWDHNHFVVLESVGRRAALIHDPAAGRRRMPLEELSKHFTGIVLEAWPTAGFQRIVQRARIRIRDLLGHTNGIWRCFDGVTRRCRQKTGRMRCPASYVLQGTGISPPACTVCTSRRPCWRLNSSVVLTCKARDIASENG